MGFLRLNAIILSIVILHIAIIHTMAQNVTVDLNSQKQTIRGFGGMNHRIWTGYDLSQSDRDLAFGNGPGQIGMTILRFWVSDKESDWAIELATAKDVIKRGGIVFATPWNPPASMCETVSRNNRQEKRLKPGSYGAYTEHLNKFVAYMKNNGVDLFAISIANEPDYGHTWTWWSIDEVYNFTKNNAGAINGTKVITAESFSYNKKYYDQILNDANTSKNIDILGAHFYGSDANSPNSWFQYPLLEQKGAGKELWMTEHYTDSDNDADKWPLALDVGYEIHRAMVEGQFNAYVWWYIRRDYGPIKNSTGKVSKRGYLMAQYSKYVRPGYVRVDATKNPVNGVFISAYQGKDSVIVVAVNRNTSSQTINISIPNTTLESFSKITTSGSKNLNHDGSIALSNGSVTVTLDAQSVTTLIGTGKVTPSEPQTPYNGTSHLVPGRIEAEEYDLGGEGSAYHEQDSEGNKGGATIRNDQVDIEVTSDVSGEHNISYVMQGEWLEYTIDVKATGMYVLDLRLAADDDGKSLHVEIDSVDLSGPVDVPNTGGWQSWATVSVKGIELTKGQHVIRIAFDANYINFNFIEFKEESSVGVKRPKIVSSKLIQNPHSSDGFRIKLDGHFNYRITDMRGAIIEVGNGVDAITVGTNLSSGIYLLSVNNKIENFARKILKNN